MSGLANLFSVGFTIAAFMVMAEAIPPPPKFVADAAPYFVAALLAEAAYPRKDRG